MTTAQQRLLSPDTYNVYGAEDEAVHLIGVDDLSQMGFLAPVGAGPAPTSTTLVAGSTSTAPPSSTTVPIFVPQPSQSSGSYGVFRMPQLGLVELVGVNDLPQMVWNTSEIS